MSRYLLTWSAKQDIGDIWSFVADDNPHAADRLIDQFYERFLLLAANPHLGSAHPELKGEIRHSIVGNYVMLYEPCEEGVIIVRVLHDRRDIPRVF